MNVVGICKVRNEAHIIKDTLDNWAEHCDWIHVYDDYSTDGTARICEEHPAVKEVISSNLIDPNRERAEWFNRQAALSSAQRFMQKDDWVVYFDADEHLWDFDNRILQDPKNDVITLRSFDVYITPEDAHLGVENYGQRQWVSPAWEFCLYFFRNSPFLRFDMPDQRHMHHKPDAKYAMSCGAIQHWGKGLSVEMWEKKCEYYTEVFGPKYQKKWEARKGKAVHTDMKCDFGFDLVLWQDVLHERVRTFPRKGHPLVK